LDSVKQEDRVRLFPFVVKGEHGIRLRITVSDLSKPYGVQVIVAPGGESVIKGRFVLNFGQREGHGFNGNGSTTSRFGPAGATYTSDLIPIDRLSTGAYDIHFIPCAEAAFKVGADSTYAIHAILQNIVPAQLKELDIDPRLLIIRSADLKWMSPDIIQRWQGVIPFLRKDVDW